MHFATFQLTSSRRGWRDRDSIGDDAGCISTHILTKRMTDSERRREWINHISTHILTKRMTDNGTMIELQEKYFNSHPHEEDDTVRRWNHLAICISTHILTKRMTRCCVHERGMGSISTHILTKRMTQQIYDTLPTVLFQLTSSRRGWLYA